MIAVAVGHALHHLDPVVDAFQKAGVQRPQAVSNDSVKASLQPSCKAFQRLDSTSHRAGVPAIPKPHRRRRIAIGPEMFEVVLQQVDDKERFIRGEQFSKPNAVGTIGDVSALRKSSQRAPFTTWRAFLSPRSRLA